jgi:hypothetical protein
MKNLAKPFVVSVSLVSIAACGKEQSKEPEPIHPNPPATPVTVSPNPPATVTHTMNPPAQTDSGASNADDRVDTSKYTKEVNPRDAKQRTVFKGWEGDKCFVEGPWPKDKPRQPGMRAPSEDVTCPQEMTKKGWEACRGGWVSTTAKGDDCICVQWGNPPPLPKRIACP